MEVLCRQPGAKERNVREAKSFSSPSELNLIDATTRVG
jgi:hypothetical protein